MDESPCRDMIALWRAAGCYEAGKALDAEPAVAADDVFYTEGKRDKRPAGLRAIWLEGPAYHGKPTRVFAWVGVPTGAAPRSLPAIVLVHGGGGTAFGAWVRKWVQRGYAAIAIDTGGHLPRGPEYSKWLRHGYAGPVGSAGPAGSGGFDQCDEALQDQWSFHAVAAVIRANAFIRSLPEVDPSRVGLTGISWGGYVTCLAAAADPRFRFAAPVYACGFYGERIELGGEGKVPDKRWLKAWDPARYLPEIRMPMLWLTGTNDFFFPLALWQRSHELPKGQRTLCLRVRYPHNHVHGWRPKEIDAFADAHCCNERPLGALAAPSIHDRQMQMPWSSAKVATLCYTEEKQVRISTVWKTRHLAAEGVHRLDALLPESAQWLFVNGTDDRGLVTSSPLLRVGKAAS